MFGKRELVEKIEALEKRVKQLEEDCAPMYVGELDSWERESRSMHLIAWSSWKDPRPRLSLRQVAQRLMDHCKLKFDRVPAVPERIEVKKIK